MHFIAESFILLFMQTLVTVFICLFYRIIANYIYEMKKKEEEKQWLFLLDDKDVIKMPNINIDEYFGTE